MEKTRKRKKEKDYMQDILDKENEENIDMLGEKLDDIKELALDIGGQVKGEKKGLDTLDDEFEKTNKFLDRSIKKLQKLLGVNQDKLSYLIIFGIAINVFLLYLI